MLSGQAVLARALPNLHTLLHSFLLTDLSRPPETCDQAPLSPHGSSWGLLLCLADKVLLNERLGSLNVTRSGRPHTVWHHIWQTLSQGEWEPDFLASSLT